MTPKNSYATLAEFKNYFTSRNGTAIPADTTDDGVLEQLLEAASRYIDAKTARFFYPRIETRYYDIPNYPVNGREFFLNADLLEIITFLNGDDVAIASTNYNLLPRNETPKFMLRMKETSNTIWNTDSDGEYEGVLDLTGIWGYHNHYIDAWKVGGTLAAAISTTNGLSATMTAGHTLASGQVWKIDNEILIGSVATNALTFDRRGDNGSTAATHDSGSTVYIWRPMDDVRNAVLEIANQAKARRFGQSLSNTETVTPGGIVISPRDIPAMAAEFIKTYQRRAP